jgi:hypothetical protein
MAYACLFRQSCLKYLNFSEPMGNDRIVEAFVEDLELSGALKASKNLHGN